MSTSCAPSYFATKVTAFQVMSGVIRLAFGHQDPTIRHQAIVAFGNIKEHTRSHEVFELCDNGVPFKSIDGKHSSKNGFDMYTATDEAGQKF
jgi:hypothetical protein